MTINLLKETIERLEKYHHSIDDVRFVMDEDYWCTWKEFAVRAEHFYYDSGFGLEEVNTNLKVVGDNWWLERHSYDGSEWWEHKVLPIRPENKGYIYLGER